jgi:hypothetical protein
MAMSLLLHSAQRRAAAAFLLCQLWQQLHSMVAMVMEVESMGMAAIDACQMYILRYPLQEYQCQCMHALIGNNNPRFGLDFVKSDNEST